jgi:hypothetical protein
MATFKLFVDGIAGQQSYRSIERARQAASSYHTRNPDAQVIVREKIRYSRTMTGWSNVDSWLSQSIRVAQTQGGM